MTGYTQKLRCIEGTLNNPSNLLPLNILILSHK